MRSDKRAERIVINWDKLIIESIDNEVIDGVSDVINSDYDRMLELWYDSGMEVEQICFLL